jgi:hypothetical protein
VVVAWDPEERHYVCEQVSADGASDRKSFGSLRELVFHTQWVASFDDLVLRALLKDRARSLEGGR